MITYDHGTAPLALEAQTDAQIATERAKRRAADLDKPLVGDAGEYGTRDMLDNTAGDMPLFNQ